MEFIPSLPSSLVPVADQPDRLAPDLLRSAAPGSGDSGATPLSFEALLQLIDAPAEAGEPSPLGGKHLPVADLLAGLPPSPFPPPPAAAEPATATAAPPQASSSAATVASVAPAAPSLGADASPVTSATIAIDLDPARGVDRERFAEPMRDDSIDATAMSAETIETAFDLRIRDDGTAPTSRRAESGSGLELARVTSAPADAPRAAATVGETLAQPRLRSQARNAQEVLSTVIESIEADRPDAARGPRHALATVLEAAAGRDARAAQVSVAVSSPGAAIGMTSPVGAEASREPALGSVQAAGHVAVVNHSIATSSVDLAPAAPAQTSIDTLAPRWNEALAGRIQWMVDHDVGEARIKLNPPELGALDVKISVVDDKTFVQLSASSSAARDELAQSLPRLRELLSMSGLELAGATVSDGRSQGREQPPAGELDLPARFAPAADVEAAPGRASRGPSTRIDLYA